MAEHDSTSGIIDAALSIIGFATEAARAANEGDLEAAQAKLAEMREKWQEGSDALDAALAAREGSE